MREMILAMLVLAATLGLATALEHADVEHTLLAVAALGGIGALAGGVAMDLLRRAARG